MSAPQPRPGNGPLEQTIALGVGLYRLWSQGLPVLALEARQAGRSVGGIVFAACVAAMLFTATWLLAQASAAFALVASGRPLLPILLVLTVLNALCGLGMLQVIRHLSRNLEFPATRSLLQPSRDNSDPS